MPPQRQTATPNAIAASIHVHHHRRQKRPVQIHNIKRTHRRGGNLRHQSRTRHRFTSIPTAYAIGPSRDTTSNARAADALTCHTKRQRGIDPRPLRPRTRPLSPRAASARRRPIRIGDMMPAQEQRQRQRADERPKPKTACRTSITRSRDVAYAALRGCTATPHDPNSRSNARGRRNTPTG